MCYEAGMMPGDEAREAAKRSVKFEVVALLAGHVLWAAVLLYGLHAPDPTLLKIGAYMLIAWLPIGGLVSYGEMRERWGGGGAVLATTLLPLALALGLGFLAWYLD